MCIISVSHPYLAASSPASLFVAVLCVRVCFSPSLPPSLSLLSIWGKVHRSHRISLQASGRAVAYVFDAGVVARMRSAPVQPTHTRGFLAPMLVLCLLLCQHFFVVQE